MGIIEVSNLTKKYRTAKDNAVDNITFSVGEGEFFAFLGPNGAGKTTTISMLTTTLSKSSGKISIAGFDLDQHPSEVRSRIGVIFQNPSLDQNLTAEENIRLHATLYKMYGFKPTYKLMPEEYRTKVVQLAEVMGLKEEIFKPIKTFSGGMKRKLEILRTLMHNPKILFLDEPTSGLDPLSRRNLWEYLRTIKSKENTTIFLTTHYLEEAEDADRVCIINHGKIVINDTSSNIKDRLVREYIYVEAQNKEILHKELIQLGYTPQENGKGFNLHIKNSQVQELIRSVKTALTKIKTVQPTLEEAYLGLVKENNE